MLHKNSQSRLPGRQAGLTTTEYVLAGALVGAAIIAAFTDLGDAIAAVIRFLAEALQ